jgi:hypothetical protein
MGAVRDDRALQQFAPLAEIERLTRPLALSSTAVESVVLYSSQLGLTPNGDTAIVRAPGAAATSARGLTQLGWSATSSRDVSVYRDPHGGTAVAVLGRDILAIGQGASIDKVTGTAGDRFLRDGSQLVTLSRVLRGSEPVTMALVWPQATQDAARAAAAASGWMLRFAGWAPLGALFERMGVGRALTAACSREPAGVRLTLTGLMQDETSAGMVSGALTLIKGLAAFVPPDQARAAPGVDLRTMTVDRQGALVSLTMVVDDGRR